MHHESKAKTYRVAAKVRWESAVRYFGGAKLDASTAEKLPDAEVYDRGVRRKLNLKFGVWKEQVDG